MVTSPRKKCLILLLILLHMFSLNAQAEIRWPDDTEGQKILKSYLELADRFLIEQGEAGINTLFEAYKGILVFGITDYPNAEIPESVEITASLFADSINSLQVRVCDLYRFPRIAAAFIQALSPESITREQALADPTQRMQRAAQNPDNSFEDEVEALNGTVPYIYYAYYPNQYQDGKNWLQMTIVFPLKGYWNGTDTQTGSQATKPPDTYSDHSADYEGYNSEDDFIHFEVFVTETPEPDSAAADQDLENIR